MPDLMKPPTGPRCGSCGGPALVQWRRRPTDNELANLVAIEQARQAEALSLADQSQPAPTFGPLPTAGDTTIAVFGCAEHAIHLEAAARVHAADCSAPHPDHVPDCDCEPEPHPAPEPRGGPMVTLPTGWRVPAPSVDELQAFGQSIKQADPAAS